ncbi:TIGR04255 family protein [Providencia rettgeri]|uniref:TIGR04255 family protein n=1 Tax=Providencia TaxID=586 RepID=UPI0034E07429
MSANHLVYVLSKIEFMGITEGRFSSLVEEFIEKFRLHYPIFDSNKVREGIEIKLNDGGVPRIEKIEQRICVLLSMNSDWSIRLSTDSLVVQTKVYKNFAGLSERIEPVLQFIKSKFEINYLKSVSIRYINNFDYNPDYDFKDVIKRRDFLQPDLNGWRKGGSNLSSTYVIEDNAVAINSGIALNGTKIPPELFDISSDFADFSSTVKGPMALLDINSFYIPRRKGESNDFNINEILDKLSELRDNANIIFNDIVITQ